MSSKTIYFANTDTWEVVPTELDPNRGGHDVAGNRIFVDSHYKTEKAALEKLLREAKACVRHDARRVEELRQDLERREAELVESVLVYHRIETKLGREHV